MFSRLSAWFVNPRRNPLARLHRDAVAARLRKYGLRYDDLYDPYHDLDIREALARLPREVVDARNARLKRAMDLSMKHQYLPEDVQVHLKSEPVKMDNKEHLAAGPADTIQELPFGHAGSCEKESAEREALGALPLYQRTIP